jgi:hypothetical protein
VKIVEILKKFPPLRDDPSYRAGDLVVIKYIDIDTIVAYFFLGDDDMKDGVLTTGLDGGSFVSHEHHHNDHVSWLSGLDERNNVLMFVRNEK